MLGTRQASARKGSRYGRTGHAGIGAAGECSAHGNHKGDRGEYWAKSDTLLSLRILKLHNFPDGKAIFCSLIFVLLLKTERAKLESAP
jgi:hypothetical protein